MKAEPGPTGLWLVDTPPGWTSHQEVGRLRRLWGTRKVGHAGTLDPMATGLLIIGAGRATRLLGHVAGKDKTYLATIRLGEATSTDDAEGETTARADASGLELARVATQVAALTGDLLQVPSTVSAIKVNGQRAYALARAGEQVELKSRPVTVTRFEILASRPVDQWLDLDVVVDCSSGTYIRALARDLGAALGVGGHLTALRRTRIGGFELDPADPSQVTPEDLAGDQRPVLTDLAVAARAAFAVVELDQAQATDVGFGRALQLPLDGLTGLIFGGQLLALHEPSVERPGWTSPVAVLVG